MNEIKTTIHNCQTDLSFLYDLDLAETIVESVDHMREKNRYSERYLSSKEHKLIAIERNLFPNLYTCVEIKTEDQEQNEKPKE